MTAQELRDENARIQQAGVIGIQRHREVLATYRRVAADACHALGVAVSHNPSHLECIEALTREVRRLRAVVGLTTSVVVGADVGGRPGPAGGGG